MNILRQTDQQDGIVTVDSAQRDALDEAGVPPAAFEVRGMGLRNGAEDVLAFRHAWADG